MKSTYLILFPNFLRIKRHSKSLQETIYYSSLTQTSVIDMLFHNPVVLARRFATLDVLSEGRSIAGLGIGWSKDEYQASNIPFQNRGKRADEFIEVLISGLWVLTYKMTQDLTQMLILVKIKMAAGLSIQQGKLF
jgi:hypothetical protein